MPNFKKAHPLSAEEIEARRMRTPNVSADLARLFVNIDHAPEMALFYRDAKRAGLELNSADHARLVDARATIQDARGLPSLEDVRALPVRRKTPQEIVAEVIAAQAPAPASAAAYVAPVVAVVAAPAREPSAGVKLALGDYEQRVQRHLQAVNQVRSMKGKPPLVKSDLSIDVLNGFMMQAVDDTSVKPVDAHVDRDAIAAARAYGIARFGRRSP